MSSAKNVWPAFSVAEWQLWDGTLSAIKYALFARMKPLVDDMNREDDPIIYSWYEHCQWKWKQWEYASVLSYLDLVSPCGRKVLDAGCGYTPLIRYLASIGMDAHGFDWDVDEWKSSLGKSSELLFGERVKYRNQDITAMDWQSGFFDYTVSVSVLEHLYGAQRLLQRVFDRPFPRSRKYFAAKSIRQALAELIRVTKPGGLIILTMDCGYGGGIPAAVVQKLLGIRISHFPDIELIRSYWRSDDYYSSRNRIYPSTPREYTALLAVLRKANAH